MPSKKTLAALRKENEMSQRELAAKLDVSAGAIGMYESGKRTPPLSRAIKIANIFKVPVESIDFTDKDCGVKK